LTEAKRRKQEYAKGMLSFYERTLAQERMHIIFQNVGGRRRAMLQPDGFHGIPDLPNLRLRFWLLVVQMQRNMLPKKWRRWKEEINLVRQGESRDRILEILRIDRKEWERDIREIGEKLGECKMLNETNVKDYLAMMDRIHPGYSKLAEAAGMSPEEIAADAEQFLPRNTAWIADFDAHGNPIYPDSKKTTG
jgi:hypothetical protein